MNKRLLVAFSLIFVCILLLFFWYKLKSDDAGYVRFDSEYLVEVKLSKIQILDDSINLEISVREAIHNRLLTSVRSFDLGQERCKGQVRIIKIVNNVYKDHLLVRAQCEPNLLSSN